LPAVSVLQIREALKGRQPLREWKLFLNDHDAIAEEIRNVLQILQRHKAELELYELQDDEVFDPDHPPATGRRTAEVVNNILEAFEIERRRQKTLY